MAAQTQEIFNAGPDQATVAVTFDNVTGAISQLAWTVKSGTLKVTVSQAAKPDIVITKTTNGSQAVPAGYNLVQDKSGAWAWRGALAYSIGWTP